MRICFTKSQLTDIWNQANKGVQKVETVKPQQAQDAAKDFVYQELKKLDTQSFVTKGKADIDTFAETQTLLKKIEDGKASTDDIRNGMEIVGLYGEPPKVTSPKVNNLIKPPAKKITKAEDLLLRERLRNQARGAKVGFKAGYADARESITAKLKETFGSKVEEITQKSASRLSAETSRLKMKSGIKLEEAKRSGQLALLKENIIQRDKNRVKTEIVEFIKMTLPVSERGRFISMVKNAETQKDITKAFLRIDTHAKQFQLNQAIKDLKVKVDKLSDSSGIDVEYAKRIKDVVSGFELQGHTEKTLERLKSTKEYIQSQKTAGKDVAMPERILEKLQILARIPKDKLTLSQIEALDNEIELLARLGKTKLTARQEIYNFEKMELTKQLQESAINLSPKEKIEPEIGGKLTAKEKAVNVYRSAYNKIQEKNLALTPMDGVAKVTGMEPLKERLDIGFTNYLNHELKTTVLDQRQELIKKFGLNDQNMERIGVHAIRVQKGGYEKLENLGISKEEADAIVLTTAEEEYYNFVRKTFDDYYGAVKDYMRDVYNKDVGQVENYVSFITDYEAMSDLEIYDRFGTFAKDAMEKRTKTVEQGFTKKRTGAGDQKIQLNIDKIFLRHTDDVAYMLSMGRDIKMLSEIVNSPVMREAMGDVSSLMWLQYLDLMARKGGTEGAKRIAAIDIIRRNLGASVLPFKLSSALVQLTSFADGASVLGGDYMFKGAANIATSKEWRKFVLDNFPEVRTMIGDDPAYLELGESWLGKVAEKGFVPLKKLDALVRTSTAAGAYEKLMSEAGKEIDLTDPDVEIIQQAQKLVRKSQGSSSFKDQPLAISRGGFTGNKSLDKLIFQFQSFMLNRWENIKDTIWREGFAKKDYRHAITGIFWLIGVAGALEIGIRRGTKELIALATNSESKEDDPILHDLATNTIQNVPVIGSMVNSIAYDTNPIPAINTAENAIQGFQSLATGKEGSTKVRGGVRAAGAVGSLAGIPGSVQGSDILRRLLENKKTSKDAGGTFKIKPLKLKTTMKPLRLKTKLKLKSKPLSLRGSSL